MMILPLLILLFSGQDTNPKVERIGKVLVTVPRGWILDEERSKGGQRLWSPKEDGSRNIVLSLIGPFPANKKPLAEQFQAVLKNLEKMMTPEKTTSIQPLALPSKLSAVAISGIFRFAKGSQAETSAFVSLIRSGDSLALIMFLCTKSDAFKSLMGKEIKGVLNSIRLPRPGRGFEIGGIQFRCPEKWALNIRNQTWSHEDSQKCYCTFRWAGPIRKQEGSLADHFALFRKPSASQFDVIKVVPPKTAKLGGGLEAVSSFRKLREKSGSKKNYYTMEVLVQWRDEVYSFLYQSASLAEYRARIREMSPILNSLRPVQIPGRDAIKEAPVVEVPAPPGEVQVSTGFSYSFSVPAAWIKSKENKPHQISFKVNQDLGGGKSYAHPVLCMIQAGEAGNPRIHLRQWMVRRLIPHGTDKSISIYSQTVTGFKLWRLAGGGWGARMTLEARGKKSVAFAATALVLNRKGCSFYIGSTSGMSKAWARLNSKGASTAFSGFNSLAPLMLAVLARSNLELPPLREEGG